MNHRIFVHRILILLSAVSLAAPVRAQNRPAEPKGQGGEQRGKQFAAPAGDGKSPAPSRVSITVEGGFRVIKANGLPDHAPGQFPNRGNPHTVAVQSYSYRIPLQPQANAQFTRLVMHPFGIALNGVVFDPGAAEWWQMDQIGRAHV